MSFFSQWVLELPKEKLKYLQREVRFGNDLEEYVSEFYDYKVFVIYGRNPLVKGENYIANAYFSQTEAETFLNLARSTNGHEYVLLHGTFKELEQRSISGQILDSLDLVEVYGHLEDHLHHKM